MLNGLYSGAAAMQTLAKHQEVISSNLMHANSSGHRRVQPAIRQRFEVDSPETTLDLGPEVEKFTGPTGGLDCRQCVCECFPRVASVTETATDCDDVW